MVSLLRDWLLDPTALQFLLAMLLATLLIWRVRRRYAQRSQRRRRRKASRSGAGWVFTGLLIWVVLYLISAAPAIVNPLIATLEDLHPAEVQCPSGSHLVVLGGGVDSRVMHTREFDRMSGATLARATGAAHIADSEPTTKLIVAGGALKSIAEADVISAYLQQLGIEANRITTESRSASTRENALYVAQILKEEQVVGSVRLVTSAMHMSRALGSFRKVLEHSGISVCPVSVDVQRLTDVPFYAWMPQTTALVKFDLWLHEVVALLQYRYKGWI